VIRRRGRRISKGEASSVETEGRREFLIKELLLAASRKKSPQAKISSRHILLDVIEEREGGDAY